MTLWHALLLAQAAVFVVWAVLAFRILFRLRARAVRDSGRTFPGLGATLRSFRGFVTRPDDRADRTRLVLLTLVLAGLSVAIALTGGRA
ncbi:MAG: hypothetical protein KF887_18670 [Paracoccaceae bacterium]|nr:MAG: hypothetical protein KF887_18670 [Paracoccaceae bacterium]